MMKDNPLRIIMCKICNRIFYVEKRRAMIRYCSEDCRKAGERLVKKRWQKNHSRLQVCKNCGRMFLKPPRRSLKYCSDECRKEGRRKLDNKRLRRKRRWLGSNDLGSKASKDYGYEEEKRIKRLMKLEVI